MTRVHPLAPVLALDIDGTLADYYEHFRWFASLYLQRPVECHWDYTDSMEFSEALGLGKEEYRQIKLAYRQGGMKRSIPVLGGELEGFIQDIRENFGVQVWIATTRPWQRLDNIDPDTQFWLNRNAGRVDGVIYGEDKYQDLIDIVGRGRIVGIVDDLPENVVMAKSLGLRAMIRAGGHNEVFRKSKRDFPVAQTMSGIFDQAKKWIRQDQDNEGAKWLSVV